jgi:phosphoglycolate phosphatase
MKLDGCLAGVYTLPAFPFPDTGVAREILEHEKAGGVKLACPVVELPKEFEKPDPRGFLKVCGDLGVVPKDVMFVGDSMPKDVSIAQSLGALDVWAEYGTYVSVEYRERLAVISAASATRRHLQHLASTGARPPSVRISGFDQILQIARDSRSKVSAVA